MPVESLTLPVASAPAQVLGAQPLKPENSLHASAGVVVDADAGLDVTVDYYRIAIDDRIVLSGNFTAAADRALLAPFGANSARFFTNAIDTRTNGVDVTASYRIALDSAGDVRLRAGYNNTRTKIVGAVATPPQLAGFESVLFDRIEQRRIECGQPKDSLRARRRLAAQPARASNLNLARYGEFCSFTLQSGRRSDLRAEVADRRRSVVSTSRGYTLAAGVQNLFDVFPDRNTTVNSFNGIQTFPSHSPFGMNGRAIYARMNWKL